VGSILSWIGTHGEMPSGTSYPH